ncbi:MAG: ABZJ_00895 family protein [Roseobacter sp.]
MFFRSCFFCINYIVMTIALFVLMLFVETLPGLAFSIAVVLILPLVISSTIEGQAFAREHKERPSGVSCWMASLRMLGFVSVIVTAVALVRGLLDPSRLDPFKTAAPIDLLMMGLFLASSAWLILRVGYAIGLASELKGQQISQHQ